MYADMTYYTWPGSEGGVLATGTIGWIPALSACAGADAGVPVDRRASGYWQYLAAVRRRARRASTTRPSPIGSSTTDYGQIGRQHEVPGDFQLRATSRATGQSLFSAALGLTRMKVSVEDLGITELPQVLLLVCGHCAPAGRH